MEENAEKICPHCKTQIKEDETAKICPVCGIPHHEACWDENMGCTTFECPEQHKEPQDTNIAEVCSKCGEPLVDEQDFCPKCGTPKNATKAAACTKCGIELQEGQDFCPKCGHKVGLAVELKTEQLNADASGSNKKKKVVPIVIGIVAIVAVVIGYFLFRGVPVQEITLAESSVTLEVGEQLTLSYTISPADATNQSVTWESTNEAQATVENGVVYAIAEGNCTVKVKTRNGKSASCTIVIEKAGPNFEEIYNTYCSSSWATVASDGSYLTIDTNPYNTDDYTDYEAYLAIYSVNEALGLPESVVEKMGSTRALDGRQSQDFDNMSVSWSYHPDNGLEVIYEKK